MKPIEEQAFKDKIDLAMRQHMEANHWKEKLERVGFNYTISLYGVVYDGSIGKHEYRRIEVFLNKIPMQFDVLAIKQFFDDFIPYNYFSVWAYSCDVKEIILVESWE